MIRFWYFLCCVCVLGVADVKVRGGVHPLYWLMCSCVVYVCSGCRFVHLRGCFILVGLGRRGLMVCRRGSALFVSWL